MSDKVVRFPKSDIPVEQIVLFEPFVAPTDPPLRTNREFKTRVVLLDRTSILAEETPEQLAQDNSFRLVSGDQVALNPEINFRLESFAPTEGFQPSRPFLSRLIWKDNKGVSQSKLMLSEPEELVSVIVQGAPAHKRMRRTQRARRASRLTTKGPS